MSKKKKIRRLKAEMYDLLRDNEELKAIINRMPFIVSHQVVQDEPDGNPFNLDIKRQRPR